MKILLPLAAKSIGYDELTSAAQRCSYRCSSAPKGPPTRVLNFEHVNFESKSQASVKVTARCCRHQNEKTLVRLTQPDPRVNLSTPRGFMVESSAASLALLMDANIDGEAQL